MRVRALPGLNRTSEENVDTLAIPRNGIDGPAIAKVLNQALQETTGIGLCVVREGNRLAGVDRAALLEAIRVAEHLGIVAPMPVADKLFSTGLTREAYRSRNSGRRIPVYAIPSECFVLRRELCETVGSFDENLPTAEAVLTNYAYRTALCGYRTALIGEAILEHLGRNRPDVDTAFPFRRWNPLDPSDLTERLKREVLWAIAEAGEAEASADSDRAVERLTAGIERVPESPVLHTARAWTLLRARRYAEVSALLATTPESVRRNREWLDIAGFAMLGLGEHRLARQCAEKALSLDPRHARALRLQGMIYVEEGNVDEACTSLRDAVRADPASGESLAHLGALLWGQGAKEDAFQTLEHAVVLNPEVPEVLGSYREAVEELQKHAEALQVLEDVRAFYPEHRHLAYMHADCLAAVGATREALRIVVECLGRFGPDEDLLERAMTLRAVAGPVRAPAGTAISLCMITKDEESVLASCLAGMDSVADEIIVVDTGSSDRTPLVAAACGARVFRHDWTEDFAAARNAALDAATGEWILSLDADERIAGRDRDNLRALVHTLRQSPAGVVFTTRNYVHEAGVQGWQSNDGSAAEEAGSGWVPSDKVRLFPRRPDVRYEYPVHEIVEHALQRCGIPLHYTTIPVHHYGRLNRERTRTKAERYAAIGRATLMESSTDDLRAVRELAAQEQELGNHAAAVPLWERIVRVDPGDARAALALGVSLAGTGRREDARRALEQAMRTDPSLREAPVKYALVALECGDAQSALSVLERSRSRFEAYPFHGAAYAAALMCAGRHGEAVHAVNALTGNGVNSAGFFLHVMRDLERAGQSAFASSVSIHVRETAQVQAAS